MNCVYYSSYKEFVTSTGRCTKCDYCGNENMCVKDEVLDEFLLDKIHEILVPTSELSDYQQAMIFECGSDEPPVHELFDFFELHLNTVNGLFIEGLLERLPDEKDENGHSILYVLNDGNLDELNDFENRWYAFNQSIRHGKRFFNKSAFDFCKDLFETIVEDGQLLHKLVVDLPVTQPLYRARVGYSIADIEVI